MRRLVRFCICCLACVFVVMPIYGQSTGTITGQVVDSQGLVIANATVTATNVATGVSRSTKTTGTGDYTIPDLSPGTYNVKVEATKFSASESKGVNLNVGDQRDLNFKLAVAGSTQTVEVTATAPLIETTKTDVSSVINNLDLERLPTIAGAGGTVNDYAQLALTVPGVKQDTSGLTSDMIAPGSINNRGNLYTVDGANITDQLVSGRDSTGASIDEVQEFKVLTNNYNAEYGQATGMIMNVVTKSGSNAIHGDGHMYFRGRNLAASDPFYNDGIIGDPRCPTATSVAGCPRAPFHRKEGGFTLGGPFLKDKLFWFTSFEMSRQGSPLTLTPGAAEGGNVTVQQPTNNLLYSGKVDYKISQNHLLSVRYAVDRLRDSNVIVQTGFNVTPDDLTSSTVNNASLNVGLISSISPTLTNEARFVFYRFVTSTSDNSTQPGVIHGDGTTTGADFCCPQGGLQKRYQYIDNVTWIHGKHTFKTGLNISYYPWNSLFPQFHFGQFTLNSSEQPTSLTVAFGPGEVTSKDNIYGFFFQDTWKLTRKLTMNAGVRYDMEAGAFKGGKIPGPNGTCFQGNGLISACSSDKNNWQPRLGFTYAPWDRTLVKLSFAETTMLAFNNVVLDSLNFDGTTLTTVTIDPLNPPPGTTAAQNQAALNAYPNLPSAALLAPFAPSPSNFGRVRPISSNLKNPEMRMVNFGIEQQLNNTLKVGAQYIGQFGFGLFGERDLNAPPLIADPTHAGFFYYGKRPNSSFGAIRTNQNSRTSHYNGLLLSVDKKMSNHVQLVAGYTWAHAITSSEDFFGLSEPANEASCCRSELGPAFNDIRHSANMGIVLDSGRLISNRYAGFLANHLGLSWVGQIQSGRPYPISTGSAPFGGSERFFGAGNETQQRPNVLPDGSISTAGIASFDGGNALFGPGAVAACITAFPGQVSQCQAIQNAQAAPAGVTNTGAIDAVTGDPVTFKNVSGNLERDAGRGSPFVKFDASLNKSFSMPKYENIKLELRFDAFNIFNHSNLIGYNSNDILEVMAPSVTNAGQFDPITKQSIAVVNPDFFSCTGCMRPNGTYVNATGKVLHLSDLQHGNAIGASTFFTQGLASTGIGSPGADDSPRKLQLSFHVRF